MGKEALGYWDYVKAAFGWKMRLPLLGAMPLNKLLLGGFGVLGFGHPAFWLLGLAYESAYLLFLPGNPRFQNLVRGTQLEQLKEEWSGKEEDLLALLDQDGRQRYRQLAENCWRITHAGNTDSVLAGMEELKAGDLKHLLWIFLNLLGSQKKIRELLGRTIQEDLDKEIKLLKAKLEKEPESSPVYRSLKGIVEIQQRRLENLTKASESLRVTEAELYRIEKQISLIQEEVAVSKDPELLSARLDGVVKSLQGTTEWMSENAQFFNTLDEAPPTVAPPQIPLTPGTTKKTPNPQKTAE